MRKLSLSNKRLAKFKISLVCSLLVILSGCAHQNFMDEGKKYAQSNQYEAAVEQFKLALNEEPDNTNTKQQLTLAQSQLNQWATALTPAADFAYQQKNLGKALLLYGKSAQITKNPHAVKRYKKIYEQLRNKSIIKAKIIPNPLGFDDTTLNSIDGIKYSDSATSILTFSQSNPVFEIQQSRQDAVTQYISGSQLIANPELVELQHELQDIRNRRRHYERDMSNLRHQAQSQRGEVQNIANQLQRAEMKMTASNLSDNQRASYNQEVNSLRSQLNSAKQQERTSTRDFDHAKSDYRRLGDKMQHLATDISLTPAVVEVPVYSDYVYQEFKQTNSLDGVLYLNINNLIRTAGVAVTSTDVSHPAHPTINLAANPLDVASQEQLTPQYSQERYKIGLRLIDELIAEHKASYLYQAQDSSNLEHKMTLLVQHGLLTHDGASSNAANMLNQMLVNEFGQGGIFNINHLLHLY